MLALFFFDFSNQSYEVLQMMQKDPQKLSHFDENKRQFENLLNFSNSQISYDPRTYECNFCNCVWKPENSVEVLNFSSFYTQ